MALVLRHGEWPIEKELLRYLSEADEPKSWAQIAKWFPEMNHNIENNLTYMMRRLIRENLLIITTVTRQGVKGHSWIERYYELHPLLRLAAL
jgi:hypothetical protein